MTKSKYKVETRANLLRELIGAAQEDIAGKSGLSDGTVGKHLRGKVSAENSKEAITEGFMYVIDDFILDGNENPLPEDLRGKEALMNFLFDRVTHKASPALTKDLRWLRSEAIE